MVLQKLHHRCKCVFFFVDSYHDLLNLDRFKFRQPTSQLLALDVCLLNVFA
ncbi:DUF645 family protein [Vibrio mimicus]|uniref:DUF645 family protein n=1 Tax=Vibrio mimicus TaxID=674 RepID=UPI00165249C4|nr:DUF645 family protein [Vibrio mimicus]